MVPKSGRYKDSLIECADCGVVILRKSPSHKRCPRCQFLAGRKRRRESEARRRLEPARVEKRKIYLQTYDKNRDKDKRNARNKEANKKRKAFVISKYGGRCACCAEDELDFLAIDHILGGGNKHRKSLGLSSIKPSWYILNSFPEGFQVLCHNCNMSKSFRGGLCVHKH